MTSAQDFRAAMAQVGSAVHVVATAGPAGRCGLTATAVASVTDDPPTLIVCINRSSAQNDVFKANGVVSINTLAAGQSAIAVAFAGGEPDMARRFALGDWDVAETGAPLLRQACAVFDCVIVEAQEVGTHSVLICRVERAEARDEGGLVYRNRGFHDLDQDCSCRAA